MDTPAAVVTPPDPNRPYRYFDLFIGMFVTVLITSNIVSSKVATIHGLTLGCGIFLFPIDYIFGDVFTEVYGYARSRRVIWIGFACAGLASFFFWLADVMTPAPVYHDQAAFHSVLGQLPRVVAASLTAYVIGEFCNSYVLARMKVLTRGRHLWSRTIGSTVVAEAIDSVVFYPLAFIGTWTPHTVLVVAITNYLIKVAVEVLLTPLTYAVVGFLKRAEHEDFYDLATDFNPLSVRL